MPLTNIQILRSAVPYKRPDPSFLLDGQLALNYKDEEPGLFAKLQNGEMIKFGPTSITTDGSSPNSNPDPSGVTGNLLAEKWFDSRAAFYLGVEKIWDGTQWTPVSGFEIDDTTGDMTLLRALTVSILNTDQLNVNGEFNLNGDLLPAGTTCVHNIGGAGERFNTLFGCELDVLNDANIGNDLAVTNNVLIGGTANVTANLFVTGQQATFGQNCLSGNFTVETPAFLNCDTSILGDVTTGGDLTVTGDTTINGANISLGQGCGFSTLTVQADTIFTCPVQFANNIFVFGDGCATSSITFNGATFVNCDILPGAASTVDLGSTALPLENIFSDDFFGNNISLVGKGSSSLTVATDPANTLVTKSYIDTAISGAAIWELTGSNEVRTVLGTTPVIPNGVTTLGTIVTRWQTVFATDLDASSLTLSGKGTSASTVDADAGTTLVTKDWVEGKVDDSTFWTRGSGTLAPKTLNDNVIPNGLFADIGEDANRWANGYFNNVFTNDLHLKNERGDWTMIEEEDVLTLRNNKTGKRYAISMTPYEG